MELRVALGTGLMSKVCKPDLICSLFLAGMSSISNTTRTTSVASNSTNTSAETTTPGNTSSDAVRAMTWSSATPTATSTNAGLKKCSSLRCQSLLCVKTDEHGCIGG